MDDGMNAGGGTTALVTSTAPVPKTVETFDRHYANRIMLLLAGIVLVVLYIEGMLTPSLPTIQSDFGVDAGQVTLIISAYAAAGVALSPVIGKLGDIYGKRKIMIAVMFTYAAAVSVTGFSPTFAFMVGARTIQGIGLTIMPLGMSLMREEFPKEMVPRAQGILSAMFGIGFAISLPLGSWVSQDYGWRTTYHTAVPFVVVMAILVFLLVKESPYRRPETRVDYLGALFLGLGLAGIVAALSQGEAWGWTSPLTVGFATLGAVMFIPFVLVERGLTVKKREPIVDVHLLAERNVTVTNVVLTVAGLGMYLALFSLIYQFEFPLASGGYNASCTTLQHCDFGILTAGHRHLTPGAGNDRRRPGRERRGLPGGREAPRLHRRAGHRPGVHVGGVRHHVDDGVGHRGRHRSRHGPSQRLDHQPAGPHGRPEGHGPGHRHEQRVPQRGRQRGRSHRGLAPRHVPPDERTARR